jgi:hypothetical protein
VAIGPFLDLLAPFAAQWHYTDVSAAGPVSRSLGGLATLLGRFEEADTYLAMAGTSSAQAGAVFFSAWNDLCWGRMHLARNGRDDGARAHSLLTHAHETAAAMGYGNIERRAQAALTTRP